MQKSKEVLKKQNRRFFFVYSAPKLRNDQKTPKKRTTHWRFVQCFMIMVYFRWYLVNPHIHYPGSLEYVCQRGIGGD